MNRATNEVIWDLDLTTNSILWSGALGASFGYTEEEFSRTFDFWSEHLHPEDRDRVLNGLQTAIRGGEEKWSDEYRFCRKEGTYGTFLGRGFILRDRSGKAIRMIGSMLDITERKRLEAEHKRLTSELEAIIRFLPVALVFYGPEGEILWLNPAAEASLAYSSEFRRKSFAERNANRWRKIMK